MPPLRLQAGTTILRLFHGPHLISALPRSPGPTHSVFDALAACTYAAAPFAQRIALLGFAAGGVVAPLRAVGSGAVIHGVDLSSQGAQAFRRVASSWAGRVRFTRAEASRWLVRQAPFDAIIEDLSAQLPGDVTKPDVSLSTLPALIRDRLAPGGIAVINALPRAELSWRDLERTLCKPYAGWLSVGLADFENRILVAGARLSATELRRRLTLVLQEGLQSRLRLSRVAQRARA